MNRWIRIIAAWGTAAVLALTGCRSVGTGPAMVGGSAVEGPPPVHSLVYVIHGDASYLYHDAEGRALHADEQALEEARTVAEHTPNAEVFIFHQQAPRRFLLFFRKPGNRLYHYRAGRLVGEFTYPSDPTDGSLKAEARLYHAHRAAPTNAVGGQQVFLYYGHEIPERVATGYHASRADLGFSVAQLAEGLERFATESGAGARFDLVVLSTCNNGTPGVAARLAPHARYLLASPENLHLSYIDSRSLRRLAASPPPDAYRLARGFARQAFDRLQQTTRTVVTMALYDLDRTVPFLNQIEASYEATLEEVESAEAAPVPAYMDCREDERLPMEGADVGVEVWYRPPQFGRRKSKEGHSGWGCRRIEAETASVRMKGPP